MKSSIVNQSVFLVDDVVTTGSTFAISFARTMEEINSGDDLLIIAMGVGGLFTVAFAKWGEGTLGRYHRTSERVAA